MLASLHHDIQDRLLADAKLEPAAVNLVDAACVGDEALRQALAALGAAEGPPVRAELTPALGELPGVYLTTLRVAGFRGIGAEHTLDLTPGPGLTLLIGRNGSGKSSFAEGLETLLTSEARRWAGRSKEWKDGWKNLHTQDNRYIEATFDIEGSDPIVLRRLWAKDADLDESELRVRRGAEKLAGLDALGWSDALSMFRPFLSYAELGALLNKPSELYDSLKGILGLEELAVASKRLSTALKACEDRKKKVKDECRLLLQKLEQLPEDARAKRCHAALKGRAWRLDDVAAVLRGGHEEPHDQEVQLLRSLIQITVPAIDVVASAAADLRRALGAQAELAGTSAEQNAKLARLLEQALQTCQSGTDACPLCGAALPADWASSAKTRLTRASELATQARAVSQDRERCLGHLKGLVAAVPTALEQAEQLQLPTGLLEAWRAWCRVPADPMALCDHAEGAVLELHAQLGSFTEQARNKLDALESAWRPVEIETARWLAAAKTVEAEAATLDALETANDWLKNAEKQIRDARFEPIADRSQEIWTILRQQSSVDLARIKLEGTGNKRRVELNVSVDGRDGVAVSVMSQGELNALALSLFLPRMMRAESPFRFLIIDDPVQAMDAHKVDGLARVLETVAKTRQVIVLTHDARLLEAIRRLKIAATVLGVQRRADSEIDVKELLNAVDLHLKDAWLIEDNHEVLSPKLAARTIPGFCRLAIEAACVEVIRRRRLGRGDSHSEVESAIEAARGVHPLITLALFDDAARGGDVLGYLNRKFGQGAATTFQAVKEGAHGSFDGSTRNLILNCQKIAQELRNMP